MAYLNLPQLNNIYLNFNLFKLAAQIPIVQGGLGSHVTDFLFVAEAQHQFSVISILLVHPLLIDNNELRAKITSNWGTINPVYNIPF